MYSVGHRSTSLCLQGPWNHAFYLALDAALPPTPDPFTITTLEKVGIDQFVQAPIFTLGLGLYTRTLW